MKKIFWLLLGIITLQACIKKDNSLQTNTNVVLRPLSSILQNNANFSMFYNAIEKAGMDSIITGGKGYTLLVPGNDVFTAAGFAADSLLHMDNGSLKKFLGYMIIPGKITTDSIPQTIYYPYVNLNGDTLRFGVPVPGTFQRQSPTPGNAILHVNGVGTTYSNILASNGVIHNITRVLQTPAPTVRYFLEHNPNYSFFVRALHNFGYLDELDGKGPFVLFAPTNTAFLNHGFDSLAVEALDTLQFKKWLVSSNILHTGIFFSSDFIDAPVPPPYGPLVNFPGYLAKDYAIVFSYSTAGLSPLNFIDIITYGAAPYYGNPYVYGDVVGFDDPDHLAYNGVVHGTINGMLAIPGDSLRIY